MKHYRIIKVSHPNDKDIYIIQKKVFFNKIWININYFGRFGKVEYNKPSDANTRLEFIINMSIKPVKETILSLTTNNK